MIGSTSNTGTPKRVQADGLMLLVAIIWGTVFVAQRIVAPIVGVFLFNGIRFWLGALILIPFTRIDLESLRGNARYIILAGFLLFGGSGLQQAGLAYTTAGNAGFISGLYVVFVPIILWLGWKVRQGRSLWLAVGLAASGMFLLSTGLSYQVNKGDILELAGAVLWGGHVVLISRVIRKIDLFVFSTGQYIVCGALHLLVGMITQPEVVGVLIHYWWALVYSGVVSVGLGYTIQAYAQKHAPPTDAAIILSSEAVFAAISGYLILGETLNGIQLTGCVLMLSAIILIQLTRHNTPAFPKT